MAMNEGAESGSRRRSTRGSGIVQAPPGYTQSSQQGGGQPPEAGAATSFSDGGGPVIPNVHVWLIFWGASWLQLNPPTPNMSQIASAVNTILTGQYMTSLSQYRSIGRGALFGITAVNSQVGTSPADPPNPFSNTDIENLIANLRTAGRVPSPADDSNLFYCVIVPNAVNSNQSNVIGEHTYFSNSGVNAHYAWVMNNGTLDFVTAVFSHELAETVTDPEGSAFTSTVCGGGGWCEIGDVCNGNDTTVDGVWVQRYWSNIDNTCVVPTDQVVKDDKDHKDGKDSPDKHHKENKDHKDLKDRKEGAKEKDKDAKEKDKEVKDAKDKDIDTFDTLSSLVGDLAQRIEELSQRLEGFAGQAGQGQSFIRPEERPVVGGKVLGGPERGSGGAGSNE